MDRTCRHLDTKSCFRHTRFQKQRALKRRNDMIKVNNYFDGNVKSLGFEREEAAFTAGVVLPGAYTFDTESEEHLTITVGEIEVQPPGSEWRIVKTGETVTIPANSSFDLKVKEPASYICKFA